MNHLTQRLTSHKQSLCKRLRHYSAYTIVPAHCTEDISSLPLNVPVYSRIICPRTKLWRTFDCTRRSGTLNESQWIEGCCTQRSGAASYVDLRRKLCISFTHSRHPLLDLGAPFCTMNRFTSSRVVKEMHFLTVFLRSKKQILSYSRVRGIITGVSMWVVLGRA